MLSMRKFKLKIKKRNANNCMQKNKKQLSFSKKKKFLKFLEKLTCKYKHNNKNYHKEKKKY